jgi:hypothetical protein
MDVLGLLQALAAADPRAAVWCAAQCARAALHLVPDGEDRPRRALEVAEAWARGLATDEDCQRALAPVEAADEEREAAEPRTHAAHAVSYAITAARAVAALHAPALRPVRTEPVAGPLSDVAPAEAGYAAWAAARALAHTTPVGWYAAFHRHLVDLLARVEAERWPLTVPTPEQLRAAPATVQVAWDAVWDRAVVELTVPALLEARARAGRLGLRWDDPIQRAVAERAVDEAAVAAILRAQC